MQVNGQEADPGCYIDSHWGQYGTDRVADVCDQFGIVLLAKDRPGYWREQAEEVDDPVAWELHHEAGDTLVETLNNVTEGGYWSWEDGDFFLTQTEYERTVWLLGHDYDDAWRAQIEGDTDEVYHNEHEAKEVAYHFSRLEPFEFRITIHYEPEG